MAKKKQVISQRQAGKMAALASNYGAGHIVPPSMISPKMWSDSIMRHFRKGIMGDTEMIQEQVHEYLKRLRHGLPFPADREEVYFECVPDFIEHWARAGYFDNKSSIPDVKIRNVVRMFTQANSPLVRVMRLTQSPREGNANRTAIAVDSAQVFWLSLPFQVPASHRQIEAPIEYPEEGKHRAAIMRWLKQGAKLDEEIDKYYKKVRELSSFIPTANVMRAVLPELLNFVNFTNEHSPPIDRNMRVRIAQAVEQVFHTPDQKEMLLSMLAAATLLPEENQLQAWLGYQP